MKITAKGLLAWYLRYWPWLTCLIFLGIYELVALFGPPVTLSAMVWGANKAWEPLAWVVVIAAVVLLYHFFFQKGRPK